MTLNELRRRQDLERQILENQIERQLIEAEKEIDFADRNIHWANGKRMYDAAMEGYRSLVALSNHHREILERQHYAERLHLVYSEAAKQDFYHMATAVSESGKIFWAKMFVKSWREASNRPVFKATFKDHDQSRQ